MKHQTSNFVSVLIFFVILITPSRLNPIKPREEKPNNVEKPTKPNATVPPWAQAIEKDTLEGDIKLSPNVQAIVEGGVRKKPLSGLRSAVQNKIYLWSNGVIPYEIDSVFDYYPGAKQVIKDAIARIQKMSCLRLIQRTSEKYYVHFIKGSGCWSYVGQVFMSGGQPISIGHGCDFVGTVLHEIMHAVGFFHTSSRYDRDSYVVVMTENVIPGYEGNFRKYTHADIDLLQAPYDMRSLMHLPRTAWSKNGYSTIEARAGPSVTLGRGDDLSEIDKAQLNLLYGCLSYPSCYKALGMESLLIPDWRISASSYRRYYEPQQGRLHLSASSKGGGAWCASQSYQQGEWLQVDLGSKKKVTGIATQGKVDIFVNAWTTYLEVWHSLDEHTWYQAFDGKIVPANFDMNSAQYNKAPKAFTARYVRLEPKYWYNEICLRVEIYGCDV